MTRAEVGNEPSMATAQVLFASREGSTMCAEIVLLEPATLFSGVHLAAMTALRLTIPTGVSDVDQVAAAQLQQWADEAQVIDLTANLRKDGCRVVLACDGQMIQPDMATLTWQSLGPGDDRF